MRAKYDRLVWLAKADSLIASTPDALALGTPLLDTAVESAFKDCEQPRDRAERCLQLLLSVSGASEGALYRNGNSGPQLSAQIGNNAGARTLTTTIHTFIESELHDGTTVTATIFDLLAPRPATGIDACELVLLTHQVSHGFAITDVAALICPDHATFTHPAALAARLSRLLAERGDAIALTSQ